MTERQSNVPKYDQAGREIQPGGFWGGDPVPDSVFDHGGVKIPAGSFHHIPLPELGPNVHGIPAGTFHDIVEIQPDISE